MNFYVTGFIAILFGWILYFGCRGVISDMVDRTTSKSYRRKNIKGIRNKLFYTSVRERCGLDRGRVYTVHLIWLVYLFAVTALHTITGWFSFMYIPLCIAITGILAMLGMAYPFIAPSFHYRYEIERGRTKFAAAFVYVITAVGGPAVAALMIIFLWKQCL